MSYNLYLKYDDLLDLNVNDDCLGSLCNTIFASIMYTPPEAENNDEDPESRLQKVGVVSLLYYNQALSMAYGVTMSDNDWLKSKINSHALMELDYTCISKDTIDEVGAVTNPNIILLQHFGIAAEWRKKGLGEKALKGIVKQMKGKCGYLVILNAQPVPRGEWPKSFMKFRE